MIEAHATARYVRTSAQKAKLVMDLIRGRRVNDAIATLRFARKSVAHDIEKVLRSAIANAQNKDGFGGDVDRLFVSACYANQGPSLKRVRPAPMGRAFRVLKRTAHLTVEVTERPDLRLEAPAEAPQADRRRPAAARSSRATSGGARKATARKQSAGAKKASGGASKSGGARRARKSTERSGKKQS